MAAVMVCNERIEIHVHFFSSCWNAPNFWSLSFSDHADSEGNTVDDTVLNAWFGETILLSSDAGVTGAVEKTWSSCGVIWDIKDNINNLYYYTQILFF